MQPLNPSTVEKSMDVMAKNIACGFADWIESERYWRSNINGLWRKLNWEHISKAVTTEQLYDMFLSDIDRKVFVEYEPNGY